MGSNWNHYVKTDWYKTETEKEYNWITEIRNSRNGFKVKIKKKLSETQNQERNWLKNRGKKEKNYMISPGVPTFT